MTDLLQPARGAAGARAARAEHAVVDGEPCTVIRDVDAMDPFMVNVVSDGDVWLFAGSNGPITAGRRHQDLALFPYETVDRLLAHADASGPRSILRVTRDGATTVWEPWSGPVRAGRIERSLAKSVTSATVTYEEVNLDLGVRFRAALSATDSIGVVRECLIENLGVGPVRIEYLDGWRRLLPPGVSSDLFARLSYLAVAYMRHERVPGTPLALYTLNAAISDRPEPSESLRAAAAWSVGHPDPVILLCDRQVEAFRRGEPVTDELEVRGEAGAYLAVAEVVLGPKGQHVWATVGDTALDHAAAIGLADRLGLSGGPTADLAGEIRAAVVASREAVRRRVAASDGLQLGGEPATTTAFATAVVYNAMRGGTFDGTYQAPSADVAAYIGERSPAVAARHAAWLASLPPLVHVREVLREGALQGDAQLVRILRTYLPITFSRRHGDPSRPWNRFTIRLKDDLGQPVYAYEGNWRDIFQNWEALARSYPDHLEAFIAVFLNGSTPDGYNPYRITRQGPDWEVLDERDPWSHIGYWGDHQLIYLLRLLESLEGHRPGALADGLDEAVFAHARVPYRIHRLDDLLADPRNSIDFDGALHRSLIARSATDGADAKQVVDAGGEVRLATLLEKLLVPALVKLGNLVPGGGIWLNTQRPEWNDANNALAGWGLSVVTVAALGRYLAFLDGVLAEASGPTRVSTVVVALMDELEAALHELPEAPDDEDRYRAMITLGRATERHREAVYAGAFGDLQSIPPERVRAFVATARRVVEATIRASRRPDGLFHTYNVLDLAEGRASVGRLELMLEGQVAVLDSGMLDEREALEVMRALRASALRRADQGAYTLVPDRELAPYLDRNTLEGEPPISEPRLFVRDGRGRWHFQADLSTAADVAAALDAAGADPDARRAVLALWAATFGHREFTGRSGRFFMFEGLGSIFWHMASKYRLAVLRCLEAASTPAVAQEMADWYADARAGLGFTKSPAVFGAFPGDPHSHSPAHRGAQQPGMTGQSKEDILARWAELGVMVGSGRLAFRPRVLRRAELAPAAGQFNYLDVLGRPRSWDVPAGSLAFTVCGVPVRYAIGSGRAVEIAWADGRSTRIEGSEVDASTSAGIFGRTGAVDAITVSLPDGVLLG